MSDFERKGRQQRLREAEGYLDLLMVFADRWPPTPLSRNRLAQRVLNILHDLEPTSRDTAYVCYLKGQCLRTMERYREAVTALHASADDDPKNFHVWLALGWCYKRINRLDLAIESLEEALEVDTAEAIIHYNLACYWSLVHNVEQALNYLSIAFDIDPNYRDLIDNEPDFDPIRSNSDFRLLTSVIV